MPSRHARSQPHEANERGAAATTGTRRPRIPAGAGPGQLTPAALLALQRTAGNRVVARQVKLGRPIGSQDMPAAVAKATSLRAVRDQGKWGQKQTETLMHYLSFFKGEALSKFILTLVADPNEELLVEGDWINDPNGGDSAMAAQTAIFPLSKPRDIRGGFSLSYFAQVISDTSESTSVMVYFEHYGGAEAGMRIPIKIFSIGASGGVRWAKQVAETDQRSTAHRTGTGIGRNFKVKKIERDVLLIDHVARTHGAQLPLRADQRDPMRRPVPVARLGLRTASRYRELTPDVQQGWLIEPQESGPPSAPLWNRYWPTLDPRFNMKLQGKDSGLQMVWAALAGQQVDLARTLAAALRKRGAGSLRPPPPP